VDVVGHEDVRPEIEFIPGSSPVDALREPFANQIRSQKLPSMKAREGQEVRMAGDVVSSARHVIKVWDGRMKRSISSWSLLSIVRGLADSKQALTMKPVRATFSNLRANQLTQGEP